MADDLNGSTLIRAWITDSHVVVELKDGREIATTLSWYPTLVGVPRAQLETFEISPFGVHWVDLDEDLSVAGMLAERHAGRASLEG